MAQFSKPALAPTDTAPDENPAPPIIVSNIERIGQGTKIASGNLWIRRWRWTWYGVLLHRRGDSEWIQLPSRGWIDARRNLRYAVSGRFDTDEIAQTFRKLGVDAFKQAGGDDL